jgi:hypothetical protein
MNVPAAPTPKRPYQPPRLMVYGTIREITGTTTRVVTHMADGGPPTLNNKTN